MRTQIGFRIGKRELELGVDTLLRVSGELGLTIAEPQLIPDVLTSEAVHALQDAGITMPSAGWDFPCHLPNAREAVDATLRHVCDWQPKVGFTYLFSKLPVPSEIDEERYWRQLTVELPYIANALRNAGIRWAIEPEAFSGPVPRLERILDIAGEDVLLNFDAANIHKYGGDYLQVLRRYHNRIRSGHLKDAFYRSATEAGECAIGQGEIDYQTIFTEFDRLGMQVTMFVEHWKTPAILAPAIEHIRSCLPPIPSS